LLSFSPQSFVLLGIVSFGDKQCGLGNGSCSVSQLIKGSVSHYG
jgi:hypothetical protein